MIRLLTAHDPDELARGSIRAVVEFADHYADVTFSRDAPPELGATYPKEQYGDFETFAAIYGKFDPWAIFLERPVELASLSWTALDAAIKTSEVK